MNGRCDSANYENSSPILFKAIMGIVSLFSFKKQKVICFALGEVISL